MKIYYSLLIALFVINGAMAQGSTQSSPIDASSQLKLPAFKSFENVQGRRDNTGKKIPSLNSELILGKPINPNSSRPQNLIQKYDSTYEWRWDTISRDWIIAFKTINIIYDANNNQTSSTEQSWNSDVWENYTKFLASYDASNNRTGFVYQIWNNNAWVNNLQWIFAYDINNNLTNNLYQDWGNNTWNNLSQFSYLYNSNNYKINESDQHWSASTWVYDTQFDYTYNANNNLTSKLMQKWNGGTWEDYSRWAYTYDVNNNLKNEIRQFWSSGVCTNAYQNAYTYDVNNNLTWELDQQWNDNQWENFIQYYYSYDANNNQTTKLGQFWNGSIWVKFSQIGYTYDTNNFITSSSSKDWSTDTGIMDWGDSTYYYYHTVLGINDLMAQNGNLIVYPNPASDFITIETTSLASAHSQLTIMNLQGQQLITRQITQTKTEFDISSLPSGIYFVRLTSDKSVATGKFIKQ